MLQICLNERDCEEDYGSDRQNTRYVSGGGNSTSKAGGSMVLRRVDFRVIKHEHPLYFSK